MTTYDLFTAPEMRSTPTPLVLARRRLAELQHRFQSMQGDVDADDEGLLQHSDEWRQLRRELREAEATVAAEESVQMGRSL